MNWRNKNFSDQRNLFELFLIFFFVLMAKDFFSVTFWSIFFLFSFFTLKMIFSIVRIFPLVPWIGFGDVVENDLPCKGKMNTVLRKTRIIESWKYSLSSIYVTSISVVSVLVTIQILIFVTKTNVCRGVSDSYHFLQDITFHWSSIYVTFNVSS